MSVVAHPSNYSHIVANLYGKKKKEEQKRHLYDNEISFSRLEEKKIKKTGSNKMEVKLKKREFKNRKSKAELPHPILLCTFRQVSIVQNLMLKPKVATVKPSCQIQH